MLEITNFELPSAGQYQIVFRGMRNAFKATDRMDSIICDDPEEDKEICYKGCPYVTHWEGEEPYAYPVCPRVYEDEPVFVLGEKDRDRLIKLCSEGSSDRKLLRQLPVIIDVNAPLYWWKQADQYSVGTTTNSESTMHTITKSPLKPEDFSTDNFAKGSFIFGEPDMITFEDGTDQPVQKITVPPKDILDDLIDCLNELLEAYKLQKDKGLWYSIIGLLPTSYNQLRTLSLNYEVALNMTQQRYDHPLKEWHELIQFFIDNLPYFKIILQAVGMTDTLKEKGYQV